MTAPKSCGVYAIVHKPSGKRYVGSSVNIKRRIIKHKYELRSSSHSNKHLQAAWRLYGEDQFEFKTLLICSPADKIFYEQKVMDAYGVTNRNHGYNLSPKACGPDLSSGFFSEKLKASKGKPSPRKGAVLTEETKARISASQKIRLSTKEAKEMQRNAKLGKKVGPYKSGNAIKTHCKRGHLYSGDNLYLHPNAKRRGCKACLQISYIKQKEKRAGVRLP